MEYNYRLAAYPDGTINNSVVERLPDNAWIPNDPANTDWQAYQEWLAAGNQPLLPAGA